MVYQLLAAAALAGLNQYAKNETEVQGAKDSLKLYDKLEGLFDQTHGARVRGQTAGAADLQAGYNRAVARARAAGSAPPQAPTSNLARHLAYQQALAASTVGNLAAGSARSKAGAATDLADLALNRSQQRAKLFGDQLGPVQLSSPWENASQGIGSLLGLYEGIGGEYGTGKKGGF